MVECGSDQQQSQGYSSLLLGLCQEIGWYVVNTCSSITV